MGNLENGESLKWGIIKMGNLFIQCDTIICSFNTSRLYINRTTMLTFRIPRESDETK